MAGDQFVLSDGKGEYYVLSRETLERARATGDRKAAILRELSENEVSGYRSELNPNSTFPELGLGLKFVGLLRTTGPTKPEIGTLP